VLRTYFNQKAATWDELIAEKDETKLERMVQSLEIKPGSVVLDVGTGTGVFLPFILRNIGHSGRVIALDIAEKMLRMARAKGLDGEIGYVQADVSSPPLSSGVFDAIVCYSSFPHFQDKAKALSEVHRLLKVGGAILICHTASRDTINGIHSQIPPVANDLIPGQSEMQAMLSAAGFTDVDIREEPDRYLARARKAKVG
jgi:ubiquinone/menaquinone biosynthesis C-methylase UbiE